MGKANQERHQDRVLTPSLSQSSAHMTLGVTDQGVVRTAEEDKDHYGLELLEGEMSQTCESWRVICPHVTAEVSRHAVKSLPPACGRSCNRWDLVGNIGTPASPVLLLLATKG